MLSASKSRSLSSASSSPPSSSCAFGGSAALLMLTGASFVSFLVFFSFPACSWWRCRCRLDFGVGFSGFSASSVLRSLASSLSAKPGVFFPSSGSCGSTTFLTRVCVRFVSGWYSLILHTKKHPKEKEKGSFVGFCFFFLQKKTNQTHANLPITFSLLTRLSERSPVLTTTKHTDAQRQTNAHPWQVLHLAQRRRQQRQHAQGLCPSSISR